MRNEYLPIGAAAVAGLVALLGGALEVELSVDGKGVVEFSKEAAVVALETGRVQSVHVVSDAEVQKDELLLKLSNPELEEAAQLNAKKINRLDKELKLMSLQYATQERKLEKRVNALRRGWFAAKTELRRSQEYAVSGSVSAFHLRRQRELTKKRKLGLEAALQRLKELREANKLLLHLAERGVNALEPSDARNLPSDPILFDLLSRAVAYRYEATTLQRRLENLELRAPLDGKIIGENLGELVGREVEVGDQILSVLDPSTLYLRTPIAEHDYARLDTVGPVSIVVDTAEGKRRMPAKIARSRARSVTSEPFTSFEVLEAKL